MKLCSLLTLLLVSANAKELFMDQYTELLAPVAKTAKITPKVVLTPAEIKAKAAADAKELKKKCSPLWNKKNGWTFGCMWDKPGM
jgi:hypothetical protein